MLKSTIKHGLLVIMGASVMSGCGSLIKDRSGEYLKSEEIPPMSLPDNVDQTVIGQIYSIPPISDTSAEEEIGRIPRPRPLSETRFEETVKIQSYDNSRWVLINRPPEEVWPRVRNILSRNGVTTTKADATKGLMQTSWVQFKDDDANSHRFLLSIEPAVQVSSTEVKLKHMQLPSGAEDDSATWPNESQDEARETQMLEIIANMLATDISTGTTSLLAQSIGGEAKVEFVSPKVADPYLKIKLNYDRSWASVMYSLSRGGFSVSDQDKTAGTVYVNFIKIDEEDEDGFFSGWFSFGDEEPEKDSYLVLIKPAEQGVEVRITAADRQSLESPVTVKLLKIIRNNLS